MVDNLYIQKIILLYNKANLSLAVREPSGIHSMAVTDSLLMSFLWWILKCRCTLSQPYLIKQRCSPSYAFSESTHGTSYVREISRARKHINNVLSWGGYQLLDVISINFSISKISLPISEDLTGKAAPLLALKRPRPTVKIGVYIHGLFLTIPALWKLEELRED